MCRITEETAKEGAMTTTREKMIRWLRFPFCACGICASYLYYGILQEQLFTNPQERLGASFVLLTSGLTNVLVAFLWNSLTTRSSSSSSSTTTSSIQNSTTTTTTTTTTTFLNHPLLILTSGLYIGAMVGSNEAIPLVSYPVAVLAKSCKLIPIMLTGQFVHGKLYSRLEWMAALSISLGIGLFHFTRIQQQEQQQQQSKKLLFSNDTQDQTFGMALLLLSLLFDGLMSSCQDLLKKAQHPLRSPNAGETMLFTNLYSLFYLIPWTFYTGQLNDATAKLDWPVLYRLAAINGTVAVGQVFIFLTLHWYSSVITTTITTTRKFFTILLSVHFFGHVFTTIQWLAIAMVFCGLYMAILAQQQKHYQSKQPPAEPISKKLD